MRTVTLSLLVPLLMSGCGSSPAGPTPAAATAPHATAVSFLLSPDAEPGKGFRPPTTVGLKYLSLTPSAMIERAAFKMIDEMGDTLTEASTTAGAPISADGSLDATSLVQILNWPAERGYGKRIDIVLTVRSASGELSTINLSIPAK